MISKLQKPINSGFKSKSNAHEIIKDIDLNGKIAIVTGGYSGIGLETTRELVSSGAEVIIPAKRTDVAIKNLEGIVPKENVIEMDLSDLNSVKNFTDGYKENFNRLDLLINNAGITQDNLAIRMSLSEWKKVIDINLTSTFLMCKSAIKKMLKNKSGKIVNITSVVGHNGNLGQANYAASKAGIVGFSKSLAIEYAKKNININCVSPGFIKTDMTDKISENFKKVLISKIPSGDLGTGEDVSNCVAFLASDEARYINGETIHVNGGMYMA